jgi:AcrR family transcriptional regulator
MNDRPSTRERRRLRVARDIELAALRLFAESGYADVTIDDIADAADISRRTFFRYFESKEDVLLVESRRRSEGVQNALESRPPHERPFEALRNAVLEIMTDYDSDTSGADLITLRAKLAHQIPDLFTRELATIAASTEAMTQHVALRMRVDPAVDARPGIAVGTVVATSHMVVSRWVAGGGAGSLRDDLADALDFLARGLGDIDS